MLESILKHTLISIYFNLFVKTDADVVAETEHL